MSNSPPDWKKEYGDEYPAAVTHEGVRMPLVKESRWSRSYDSEDGKMGCVVSRFMDGSAAITLPELVKEWPSWGREERQDFCGSCSWLHEQADFPDMLRYIMEHGGPYDWSAIANPVGATLPQEEAFQLLNRALQATELELARNIPQGIAVTRHPDAARVLHAHLGAIWDHPTIWDDAEFTNWYAYAAVCCIDHLIELGEPPAQFTEHVQRLASHSCAGIRRSCRGFLGRHYPWLKTPD